MPADLPSTLLFLARLLLGGAFVFAGLRNIQN
ncbi:DoxX family protein, partial [Mesorhizobium sp. M7A.F.Ca.CA.001.10.2.1]